MHFYNASGCWFPDIFWRLAREGRIGAIGHSAVQKEIELRRMGAQRRIEHIYIIICVSYS